MRFDPPSQHPLLKKLDSLLTLTEAEREALLRVPCRAERVTADHPIIREGARPRRSLLLTEGLACSSKIVGNGGRQIISFHIVGDFPDLTSLHLDFRDCDVWALTDCELAATEHRDLAQLCAEQPRLAAALWRITLVDAAIFREWVVNVGQRDGISRVAHVFCEMMARMAATGQAKDGSCALPVTQGDLAEATGLSVVHVNRMIQELRQQELISFARGRLTIHDWDALAELADFRDDYLHLRPAA